MVCGCRVPAEQYPENAEWGPLFWTLLHGLAEYAGKQPTILQGDELRLWQNLLKGLQPTIPCDICRGHYAEKLAGSGVDKLLSISYPTFGDWLRHYLWNLHNEINEGNDKPTFPFEELAVKYKGVDITKMWRQLEPIMKKAISLNGITLIPWRKFLGYVRSLQGLYG